MNKLNKNKQKGFTLIELMIVIAIIGILAAIAVPQYGLYVKRAKYSEVVSFTSAAKSAVSLCHQENNSFASCNGAGAATDDPGIPSNINAPGNGYVESLTTALGVITATGTTEVDRKTYILEPSYSGSTLEWTTKGTCLDVSFCK